MKSNRGWGGGLKSAACPLFPWWEGWDSSDQTPTVMSLGFNNVILVF